MVLLSGLPPFGHVSPYCCSLGIADVRPLLCRSGDKASRPLSGPPRGIAAGWSLYASFRRMAPTVTSFHRIRLNRLRKR